jgi:hypothetical protein
VDISAAWAVVVGVAVASAAPLISGLLDSRNRRLERREIDQRATLHAVQDDMLRLRNAASTRLMFVAEGRGLERSRFATDELMTEFDEASGSLVRYGHRIRDHNTREALFRYHAAVRESLGIENPADAEPKMRDILDKYSTAQDAVGNTLRKL